MPQVLNKPVVFERVNGANIMTVPMDQATVLFEKHSIVHKQYDQLPMYSLQSVGNSGVASFANFIPPKHILQPRLNACSWNPKGKVTMKSTQLDVRPVEVNMDQCPDVFYGSNWERIFGPGVKIIDLMGTDAGKKIANELLRLSYIGLGNSVHGVAEFGQNEIITAANDGGWSPVTASEWADYTNQQAALAGRMTIIDNLKTEGLDNANVDIDSFVDGTGAWSGDIFDFLDSLILARPSEFEIAEDAIDGDIKGIIEMDKVTFRRLSNALLDRFNTIPETWKLFVYGEAGPLRVKNYLYYNGYAIMPNSTWSAFDAITGVTTRRALLSYPGVYGLAFDVPSLKEYDGLGLMMYQSPDPRDKGKIALYTGFKLGVSVINPDFFVNASTIILPPSA